MGAVLLGFQGGQEPLLVRRAGAGGVENPGTACEREACSRRLTSSPLLPPCIGGTRTMAFGLPSSCQRRQIAAIKPSK